ncbi:MAG: T9SS type A sorting domain-containing protein [Candidatus Limisoma sp.]
MKKSFFLVALAATAVSSSAQISFQSSNYIHFVPGALTSDNIAKIHTISDENNVEIYDESFNLIKSFTAGVSAYVRESKTETCSDYLSLTGCSVDFNGYVSKWDENGNEHRLTATSVDDMIAKLNSWDDGSGREYYKITINGVVGAYNDNDFYSLDAEGQVLVYYWSFSSYDSSIENESALTWVVESDDIDEYNYGLESLEYYNFDNSSNTADMSYKISQTLFNNDSKWEYVIEKYGPLELNNTRYSIDFDGNGKAILRRHSLYSNYEIGYSIMNEDGVELAFIAKSQDAIYPYMSDVCVFGNKKYLRWGEQIGDVEYVYLTDIDNYSDVTLTAKHKSNMRIMSQGDMVEIILPKDAADGEVGIVGMNGQTLGKKKVNAGQNRATFNSANLAKGVYNATFTHKNGKRESQKFIVK